MNWVHGWALMFDVRDAEQEHEKENKILATIWFSICIITVFTYSKFNLRYSLPNSNQYNPNPKKITRKPIKPVYFFQERNSWGAAMTRFVNSHFLYFSTAWFVIQRNKIFFASNSVFLFLALYYFKI